MKKSLFILLLFISAVTMAQQRWESQFVKINKDGSLRYIPDEKGDTFPDFSRVGYYDNQVALPWVNTVRTISPSANDQETIQKAIDEVAALPLGPDGFRGAILLKNGTYKIPGTLKINTSGIVLRGETEKGTKLIATGKGQRKMIVVNGSGNKKETANTRIKIADAYVPVGAKSFRLTNTNGLKAGAAIVLFRPGTAAWIAGLKMDQITPGSGTVQWKPSDYNMEFERVVTAIKGNTIYIDQPVVMAMETQYGGGEIYQYTFEGRISNVGIEQLYCESEFTKEDDEDHGWDAVSFNRIANGWVRNVTSKYFGYSCVNLGAQSRNITVINCKALTPKSKVEGGRRYSFNNDGQLNLFMNCYALEGRHDYVTGAHVAGPNVFFNCVSEQSKADNGPHHRWAMGTLYDNVVSDGEINIQDRGNWGTGHGWAGVNQILWNCKAAKAVVQNPWVSGKNYSIGLTAVKYNGRLEGRPDGVWEGQNQPGLDPSSLYLAQVRAGKPKENTDFINATQQTLRSHILKEAAWALTQQPVTVTANSAIRSAGGKHDFYSEGDYWWPDPSGDDKPYIQKDGLTNPANFTAHREAMIRFSRIVGALASAYKLTGDKKYVKQALLHCKAWFTDAETLMNPSLLYAQAIKGRATGRGIGIIDTIQLMEVVQGLLAMRDAGIIEKEDWNGFREWFAQYLKWLTTHPYGKDEMEAKNNHGTCWVMQVAVFAKFTENQQLLDFCVSRFKNTLLPDQMAEDGSFPLELKRTKPYGYSIFNLDAMATICQTLSTPADDLWNYTTSDGKSVKKGIEFLYPYLKDKTQWPFNKDVMYWENWPVAQPSLLFGAVKFENKTWQNTWKLQEHAPIENEVIRNLPVRNPIIWLYQ